jgi:UDP-4-amino-4,6-dideoxy-N-acetyl-beta-L-altrosamine N-acetyltransferase
MFTDRVIRWDEHVAWFRTTSQSESMKHLIFELSGRPAGLVNFSQIDKVNRKCVWGFYLGEEGLPKGTGAAMGYLALDDMFNRFDLHKISGEVLGKNVISINFHKKLGFKEEGHFHEHVMKNGEFDDVLFFSLFQSAWHKHKLRLAERIFGIDERDIL